MMGQSTATVEDIVEEIMRIHRSLPARPGIDEVEAARTLIQNVDREDQLRMEVISKQIKGKDVPVELFSILQEMQKYMIQFQSIEHKREALKLLDLEGVHMVFGELLQRATKCLPSVSGSQSSDSSDVSLSTPVSFSTSSLNSPMAMVTSSSSSSLYSDTEGVKASRMAYAQDDGFLKMPEPAFSIDGIGSIQSSFVLNPPLTSNFAREESEKLSLVKLASLIQVSAKKGIKELNLQGKLSDQVEWLPDSISKLSFLITLDLSENRLAGLPDAAIGGLSSLQTLDLHGNRISKLPESIGDLLSLIRLDLRGNQLTTLPPTIARLVHLQELDLSSNAFSILPETIGSFISLHYLNVETNDIEEIPHSIGRCTSLKELHADYNKLKALPEAIGRIETLEILTVRYNNIRQFPTTMASLTTLRELDASFNELEYVPESLCFATTLVKMNISNNFADLQSLPRSIGNLEKLEELDMSNNQIRVLPDSFRMLTNLRVLKVDGNPLSVPPRNVVSEGAQAVVQYMANLHAQKDVKLQPVKQKKSWANLCFLSKSNKRKRSDTKA